MSRRMVMQSISAQSKRFGGTWKREGPLKAGSLHKENANTRLVYDDLEDQMVVDGSRTPSLKGHS